MNVFASTITKMVLKTLNFKIPEPNKKDEVDKNVIIKEEKY